MHLCYFIYYIKLLFFVLLFLIIVRFIQLQHEEEAQRERAEAAERHKMQLEIFIDMICHEIRNPYVLRNGVSGD
jgi:signal transduction histidine kinase